MALPPVPAAPTLSEATSGDETQLYLDVGAGWVEVAELDPDDGLNDLPSGEQSTYETTHMKSGTFKEFKKNKRREGAETQIKGNLVFGSASETTLQAAEDSADAIPYLIVLKQGDEVWQGTGFALFYDLKRSNPGGDVRQFTITAKWVTEMTLTQEGVG